MVVSLTTILETSPLFSTPNFHQPRDAAVGIESRAEAKRVYQELILELNDKFKRQTVPIWSEFVEQYLVSIRISQLTNGTIYSREKLLKAHTMDAWGRKMIDEISTSDIHLLLQERFAKYSEAHRKFFVKCVRSVFQFAVDRGILIKNPTPLLKFKANEKIKSVLNEEQILTLLRRAQEQDWEWYPHYAVALFTGLRNGEMYQLTWDKVDLEARTIKVDCSWSSKNGVKSTKSGDDRIVEIPEPLLPLLRELKMQSAGDGFVLPRLLRWEKGEQARFLRIFLQLNGLPQVRFHDLRASWATLLLGKGVIPSQVMSMGGWKDMDTMMIYMRKAGIDIKGATSVLDGMNAHGLKSANVLNLRPSSQL